MGIYGQNIITEASDLFAIDENRYMTNRPGLKIISENKKNPDSVNLFVSEGNKYYLSTSDIEKYMEASSIIDVEEAVENIAECNNVSPYSIIVSYDECSEFVLSSLIESSIVLEASAEDAAMSLSQANKWYNKVIQKSKTKTESKEEVKERIIVLKSCVKEMEKQKNDVLRNGGIIKYVLKDIIPFNSLYRLIKRQDAYAGIGILANMAQSFIVNATKSATIASCPVSMVIRAASYEQMLDSNIKKTNEAIEFLENKLKEM